MESQEIWKPIPGYEGFYEVSSKGRVKSLGRVVEFKSNRWAHGKQERAKHLSSRILRHGYHPYGYPCVGLCSNGNKDYRLVHHLVLLAFVGPMPEGQETRHLNDIHDDNRWPENLCYGTPKENGQDQVRNGKSTRGERHAKSKLLEKDVRTIREYLVSGVEVKKIAKIFNISITHVYAIKRQKTWAWLKTA